MVSSMTRRVYPAIMVLTCAMSAQVALADGCKVANYGTLPVEVVGGRATTMVKINGRDTRLMLDTGAFYNVMSRANADAMGLKLEMAPVGLSAGGVGGSAGLSLTHVKDFGILGASLHNIEFLVGGSDVGMGILGANLLDLADLDLDLAQGKLGILKPSLGCQKLSMAYWAKGGSEEVKLLSNNSGARQSEITVMVNGKPVRAMLDTGAPTTVITRKAAARTGIDLSPEALKSAGMTSGFGKKHYQAWIARVALYQIGSESIQNSRMTVIDGDIEDGSEPDEMLLGLDFILSHHIWVANSQRKIYFSYNGGRVSAHDKASEMSAASTPGAPTGEEPKTAQAYALRGQAKLTRGDTAGAVDDLDKAIAMAPNAPASADFYYARARAKMTSSEGKRIPAATVETALSDLDMALQLAPDQPEVLIMRARLHLMRGLRDKAERDKGEADVATLRSKLPAGSALVRPLVSMLIETGQPVLALPLLDDWLRLHPEDSATNSMLNLRCWARGLAGTMLEEAAQDCRKVIKREGPKPAYLDSQSLVELRLGHNQAALDGYQQVLAQAPGMGWARYGQALAKLRLGQAEAGQAELAAVTAANPNIVAQAKRFGLTPP